MRKTVTVASMLAFSLFLAACGPSEYEKEKLAFEKKKYEDEQAAKAAAAQKDEQDKAEQKEHWIACRDEAEEDYNSEFRNWGEPIAGTAECPKPLQHFWSGHAQTHVSERYIKLLQNRDYRLEWAEKIGMGFDLPACSTGLRGLLIQFRKMG